MAFVSPVVCVCWGVGAGERKRNLETTITSTLSSFSFNNRISNYSACGNVF